MMRTLPAMTCKHSLVLALSLQLFQIASATDIITLKDKTYHGTFKEYRSGRFYLQTTDGKSVDSMKAAVKSLIIEPPVNVSMKPFSGKEISDAKFKSYENGIFTFLRNGTNQTFTTVSAIKVETDISRSMYIIEKQTAEQAIKADETDLVEHIQPGSVTVVHFHMKDIMSSVRQGNYINLLASQNAEQLKFIQLTLSGWQDAAMEKYNLTSLPQFWIYDREGKLSAKLQDRFTEEDIDNAIIKAGCALNPKKRKR